MRTRLAADAMPTDATTLAADAPQVLPDAPPAATVLAGRYLVLSLLGKGGMGRVYLARDTELDELVAVKLLLRDWIEQPGMLTQLRSEVKLARRVTHPNVVRTFDIGSHEGQRFITLEYIEGESLAAILARGPLTVPVFLATARALCDGLGAAHAVGIVHRDLKPANVLVAADGRVAITDFGIACTMTSPDAAIGSGTPPYMAPEQLDGRPVDARTDIYALGLVFFEMLTARRPFFDPDRQREAGRRLLEPPPDLREDGVPSAIAEVVRTAMSTLPEHRHASAGELKAALALVAVSPAPLHVARGGLSASARSVAIVGLQTGTDAPSGLEEHLADMLRRLGLRVPSSSAVHALRGQPPLQIGRALAVDAVLELELRYVGTEVEAEARLQEVADGILLFRIRERVPEGALLQQLALRIVSSVGGALHAHQSAGAVLPAPLLDDPETLALYTQARRLYHQRWAEPNDQACALLQQALLRRPDDPTLVAAFALALARRCVLGAEAEVDRAFAVAERARALAPWSPDPHVAAALLQEGLAEDAQATRDLRAALRLAPWHPESHARIGELAAEAGLVEEAERHLTIAGTLEPALEPPARWARARLRALAGDIAGADAMMGPPPTQAWMQNAYFIRRARLLAYDATPERIASYRSALVPCAFEVKGPTLSVVDALETGQLPEAASSLFQRLGTPGRMKRRSSFFHVLRCEILVFCGRSDEALEALAEADERGLADALWMERCAVLDPLRASAAFRTVTERVRERGARVAEAYRRE